jgi:FkbM family methyltransferase
MTSQDQVVPIFAPYIARNRRVGNITFDFWITDTVADKWYARDDSNDLPECAWLLSQVREGMTVADCGAHHGFLTVAFSKAVGRKGRVGAWEALPDNAAVIDRNLSLNGCDNVVVRAVALGDQHRRVPLWSHTSNCLIPWKNTAYGNSEVEMVCLDDEIPPDTRIDLIKIDVEGSDLQMIRGARRVLSGKPIIDLELHCSLFANRVATLTEIFAILEPLGYSYSVMARPEDVTHPIGWRLDVGELGRYGNPHVFCLPAS